MLPAIIIISMAIVWLGLETDWLRVNLIGCIPDADMERNFDGSDHVYLADYESQLEEAVLNAEYQSWLDEYHAPKFSMKLVVDNSVSPKDKWLVVEEDLRARRQGEMLYQRGI